MTQRKTDHLMLAALSAPATNTPDERFVYEPLLSCHIENIKEFDFLGKKLKFPLWISSMTGGTEMAGNINKIFAEACAEFGLGMGLGSCRHLLEDNTYLNDFDLRPILGDTIPFYANLGIAQVEKLIAEKKTEKILQLVSKLRADGLIIHVNPAQEWLQPEGDRFTIPPIETIANFLEINKGNFPVIIKEVGQGMGPKSIEELLNLPIDCIELGAFGGTNFSTIEISRSNSPFSSFLQPLTTFGHNAPQMLEFINSSLNNENTHCKNIIISGGIRNFLDGYYLQQKSSLPAIFGMANVLLQHAMNSREDLFEFIETQINGYKFALAYLKVI